MPNQPMEWLQGPWLVELHTVNEATYRSLELSDMLRPQWIISYVHKGDVLTETRGEIHRVRAGDVMLHPPNLPFSERSGGEGVHFWLQVSLLCSHHIELLQLYRVSPVVTLPDPQRYEKVFAKLQQVWNDRGQSFRDLKLTSAVLQLTEMILTGWEKAGSVERSAAYESAGDRFARLIGRMSHRLADKLDREQLAGYVNLNANYLDRAFRRQYGLTPMQMLRDMRLKRARQLLGHTEDTLEAIASQCGLTDAGYLCKQFKKRFGALPGEYREAVRAAQLRDIYGSGGGDGAM